MSLPFVSCRCMTHARVSHLQTALACFLSQDYSGPKELVILNDCPEQVLSFDHPQVQIFNLKSQIPSLGEKENRCIDLCQGSIIFFWDDDDFFLPHHISTFIREMLARDWSFIQNDRCWNWNGHSLSGPFPSHATGFAFTKDAWRRAGKFPHLNGDHDQPFLANLRSSSSGGALSLPTNLISYAYGWNNGVYHVSGLGPDSSASPSAIQRFRADALSRLASGSEPSGLIHLYHSLLSSPIPLPCPPA